MDGFRNADGKAIVEELVTTIKENAAWLSEVDGAIGDGDHGINMSKGFSMCGDSMAGKALSFTESLMVLGKTLLMDIGGSMGPLYGGFFKAMAKAGAASEFIEPKVFLAMLETGIASIQSIGSANQGDKTLLDTLIPACGAFRKALESDKGFAGALDLMVVEAEKGMLSTKDMVARIGRAARLGERSRGVLDAGASSSFLILKSMGLSIKELLV